MKRTGGASAESVGEHMVTAVARAAPAVPAAPLAGRSFTVNYRVAAPRLFGSLSSSTPSA